MIPFGTRSSHFHLVSIVIAVIIVVIVFIRPPSLCVLAGGDSGGGGVSAQHAVFNEKSFQIRGAGVFAQIVAETNEIANDVTAC